MSWSWVDILIGAAFVFAFAHSMWTTHKANVKNAAYLAGLKAELAYVTDQLDEVDLERFDLIVDKIRLQAELDAANIKLGVQDDAAS